MSSIILKLLYNIVFVPFLYLILLVLVPFNAKIRKGVLGRIGLAGQLRSFKRNVQGNPVAVLAVVDQNSHFCLFRRWPVAFRDIRSGGDEWR